MLYNVLYISVVFSATCGDPCRAYAMSMASVCPSVTSVNCDHIVQDTAEFLIPHERAFSDTNSGWQATLPSVWNLHSKWPTHFEKRRLRQISAYYVSTVVSTLNTVVLWCELGEVENESISHNFSLFAVFLCKKLSKLVEIWQSSDKYKFAQFFWDTVYNIKLGY